MAVKFQGGRAVPVDNGATARRVLAGLERLMESKDAIYRAIVQLPGPDGDKIRAKLNTIDQAAKEAVFVVRNMK